MPITELKPEDAIDRDAERDLFTELLQFKAGDDARLLTIKDKVGSGKTTLLQVLKYNCERIFKPARPVCLISLDDQGITAAFDLVKKIIEALSSPDFDTFNALNFATFESHNTKRLSRVFSEFAPPSATYTGTVYAERAQVGGNPVIGGVVVSSPHVTINPSGEWGFEQEEFARQQCIKAFFADLKSIGEQEPVIVLLDSFDERCLREIRAWILKSLVPICFDLQKPPMQFVLVLAGRGPELPDFSKRPEYDRLVKSIYSLDWTRDHVKAFLTIHGYDDLTEDEFNMVWAQVQSGEAIGRVLKLADLIKTWKAGR